MVSPLALILGVILIVSYFTTMKFVISINANNGIKIMGTGKGKNKEVTENFINTLVGTLNR